MFVKKQSPCTLLCKQHYRLYYTLLFYIIVIIRIIVHYTIFIYMTCTQNTILLYIFTFDGGTASIFFSFPNWFKLSWSVIRYILYVRDSGSGGPRRGGGGPRRRALTVCARALMHHLTPKQNVCCFMWSVCLRPTGPAAATAVCLPIYAEALPCPSRPPYAVAFVRGTRSSG